MTEMKTKLPQVGQSIFSTMTQLAQKHKAINLSQGFPDFDCDPELVELAHYHMHRGHNQYAPSAGVPSLRKGIAKKLETSYQCSLDWEGEITVTTGATEGLYASFTALVGEGDEVILFAPSYDSYDPVIRLNGGRPRYIQLCPPEYSIPWKEVEEVITPQTRAIVVNTPHNPTGTIWKAEDMEALSQIVEAHGLFVISDEVYQHILFDGEKHESILRYPPLRQRGVAIFSFGKTYHATGWKVGYCAAPAYLTEEIRKIHQYLTFCTSTPHQMALAKFIERTSHYLELGDFYQKKRDIFLEAIEDSPFRPLPCQGTYFQLLDYSEITDEGDVDFARRLTREQGVASIPVSVFNPQGEDEKVLRFCFAKREETLREGGEKLCQI